MGRIIAAEDDKSVHPLLKVVLKRAVRAEGHSVTVCWDGQEALDEIRSDPTDVILVVTDFNMPNLNGLGLVQGAAALGVDKFIVQSDAIHDPVLWAQFVSAAGGGAIIPLPKPWIPSELKTALQQLLQS